MKGGCGTTQHCADHGWCRRCDPGLSALMSEVNAAIQSISTDEQTWGPLYSALGRLLGGGSERVTLAAELIEARRTNQRLNLRVQRAESKIRQHEKGAMATGDDAGLPPFSGDDTVCRKCSHAGAETRYRARGEVPEREEGTQSFGDIWPERLERECGRCRYQWDEALNLPTREETA